MQNQFPVNLDDVVIYLRKSREDREAEERARKEERDEYETLARHRGTLLDLAHKHGHNIVHIYEEVVSGEYIDERPEVKHLLSNVENGDVTAVWVMDIDRLGRGDMADQGVILRTFKESNTLILTPDKVYDLSDEMDEEWTEFKTFFARRELKMITKRMQRGRVASVQEGKYIGTRPPFGYDISTELILIANDDATTVKQIFDLYVNGGLGCNRIAQYLNSIGIKTPTGKLWRGESVLSILKNEVYAGWIVWRKVKHDKRKGTRRQRPKSERIRARGKHEPLIDEITYRRSVQIRERRNHAPVKRNLKVSSPLSGLIQCAKCGEMMVRRPYTKQAAHLICKNPNCPQKSTRLSIVEERLIQSLSTWLINYRVTVDEVSSALEPRNIQTLANEKLLKSIDAEINTLNEQRDSLHNLLERHVYDDATYLERNQKLLHELSMRRERRQNVVNEIAQLEQTRDAQKNIIPHVSHVLSVYKTTDDVAVRNQLLRTVLHNAVYNKEKWQYGDQFELVLHPVFNTDNI